MRVVDTADEKAELCGRLLADLGADVVRVDPPGGGRSRRIPPRHGDHGLYYAVRNFNKRGAAADLDTVSGRERLLGLLERADVWVDTSRPGALAAAGLDPTEVSTRLPHLVVASITDFGQTGPYRDWTATDDVIVALSGELFRSGVPGLPPLLVPGALAYDVAGIFGAFAVLAAHWQKISSTGRGQHLDVSVLEATAQVTDWSLPNYSAIRSAGGSYGQVRSGHGPVYPLYPCADGYVRLVILSPRQWHAMREWLGEPEFLQDPHWDTLLGRMSIQHDILDPMFAELFSKYGMAELSDEAQRRGIVMTPCLSAEEVLRTEHYRARGSFVEAEVAPGVSAPVVSGFFEIEGRRAGFRRRAPAVGEHDGEIEASWPEPRPAPAGAAPEPRLPFEGLLVLDFGHGGVGVEAGRLFAEYGADVIKIESRTYPDFMRLVSGGEISASFASSSRSKRSLGVNVKTERGAELIRRLVASADVVIENNSTGTMADLGLGYEDLKAVNPGVVMVSSQLMGSSGPWASWLGYGPSTRPPGGMTWLWNFPGGGMPPGSMVIFPDHLAGRVCAVGALAGLVARQARGTGTHVEVAQVETVLGMMSHFFLKEALEPGSVQPEGNRRERGAPWGVYQCAGEERWIVITCRHDADWANLRAAMGEPEWAADPELATAEGRRRRHDDIDSRISAWTSGQGDRDLTRLLQAHGVPAGLMMYASDQPEDPHLQARGYCVEVAQPGVGDMLLEGPGFRSAAMPAPIISAAPWLGEHTRRIARDLLGLSEEETEKLLADGVLEETPPGGPAS
ncbi:MAG TPA: CoA transferase [Acidimicrobiales bacterium]|nr:CoA transferase [Acidimicrobiales bacterium]